jgi:predicted phosphodiesterase
VPTPPLSDTLAKDAVARVEDKLRLGYVPLGMGGGQSAVEAAATQSMQDGWTQGRQTFHTRLRIAKERYGLEPDWSLHRPHRYSQPVPLAVVQSAVPHAPPPLAGAPQRILVIGDLHQDPRHEDRLPVLTWMARYASDHRPERIIQVGDWSTFDSVNQHDKNDTFAARSKPGIRADLDNLHAGHQAFRRGMDADYRPKLDFLLGNHENRLERFENANPEAQDTFTLERDQTFVQHGWRTRPYGELFYVDGVAFTHHPTNGAGRAYGGKTGPQRAANESTVPVVSGHTHRRQVHDSPKIGPIDVISMVEVGCGLPWGTVEAYAKHGLTGWWYGVCAMTVQAGAITDLNFVSMLTLRDRYADEGEIA